MKVPFPANNQNQNNNSSFPNYEPKSVLDLRGSPSPVTHDQKPVVSKIITAADNILAVDDDPDDHNVLIDDDLDSLMRDWGLHDDSTAKPVVFSQLPLNSSQITTHHQISDDFDYGGGLLADDEIPPINMNYPNFSADQINNWNIDYVDELLRLADCFETNSLQLGHVILARLNQQLRSPTGKPLQRAAFYFKEALQFLLLTGSTRPSPTAFEIVQTIKAQKAFSSVSPIPMFAAFTANQSVLEALDAGSSSTKVHVIDFDIGLGGHWASFMKELADRAESRKLDAPPPVLRISALVPEAYAAESGLIRENLAMFARELNIRFDIDFVLIRTFEYLSFKAFQFMDGEKVAVILSPAIFRYVGTGFLNDLRRISPYVVVHVDVEGQVGFGTASYRQAVIDGLGFYSTLLESLEAANINSGGSGDWMRRIETFVVYPKISEGVEGAGGRRGAEWSEALVAAGLRQVGLSQFAEFQAECLLRRVQIRGFHVAKRQDEMLLCWNDRPLVATSAWRY